jgi:CRISPR/Cas system-associated exonuclease Cas4 (RecB family)
VRALKKRRVVRYLMVSNIAQQHWCHQFSIYRAVEKEKAVELLVKELREYPENKRKIKKDIMKYRYISEEELMELEGISEERGKPWMVISSKRKNVYLPIPDDILKVGEMEQKLYAERYTTVETFFVWKEYTIVACPDGISDDFCYEFKSTGNPFFYSYVKPVVLSQVHIYSYFYKKPKIRAQIRIRSAEDIETIEGRRDNTRVEKALDTMDKLLRGKIKPIPPAAWKCRKCEYTKRCSVKGKK